jgi:hypothetical protein
MPRDVRTDPEQDFVNKRPEIVNKPPLCFAARTEKRKQYQWLHGERGGTRTLDPMIKSHVLYHLSYALTCRAV